MKILCLALLQTLSTSSYILFVVYGFGIPKSLSDAQKWLKSSHFFIFPSLCILNGLSMLFFDGLFFQIAAFGFCLVGVSELNVFSKNTSELIHTIGALLGFIGALFGQTYHYGVFLPLIIIIFTTLPILIHNRPTTLLRIELWSFSLFEIGFFYLSYKQIFS